VKLLIVTQKVDRKDPILGFFHGWLIEFSKHCEKVSVIGQLVGEYNLPENVEVYSLGKEKGYSRLRQIFRFAFLIWKLRKEYTRVLVHMTPVWVIMGWDSWLFLRKRVFLWYEARGGGWVLPLSLRLVNKVFSATEYGLPRKSKKSVITGHGIDTEFFKPSEEREDGLVVSVGRITQRKHFEVVLKAFSELPENYKLLIAGVTIREDDERELKKLQGLMNELNIAGRVTVESKTHDEVSSILSRAGLMLHACRGGLDKVVLEAMASGCPLVSSSVAAKYVLPEECLSDDETMGEKAKVVLGMSENEHTRLAEDLRKRVVENHSLEKLVGRLVGEMQ